MKTTLPLIFLLFVAPTPALAQTSEGFPVTVEGSATVITASGSRPLRARDRVFPGDGIATGVRSIVRTSLPATVIVRELSMLRIAKGEPMVVLERGKVGYAVGRTMTPSVMHEIRTANARVHVSGVAIVEVELRGVSAGRPAVTVTSVYTIDGSVRVHTRGSPDLQLEADEGVRIVGELMGPVHRLTRAEVGRAQAGLGVPNRSPASQPWLMTADHVGAAADWDLLIDRGAWFERWVGTSTDGCVAGDCAYEALTLAACVLAARTIAADVSVACARAPHEHRPRYRDPEGRLMATGPFAGRLVVFEPAIQGESWMAMSEQPRPGRNRYVRKQTSLTLSDCQTYIDRRVYSEASPWACVGPGRRANAQYVDVQGGLMAEGPFAGGMVVYEPSRRP